MIFYIIKSWQSKFINLTKLKVNKHHSARFAPDLNHFEIKREFIIYL